MKTLISLFISLSWLSGVLSSNQLVQSDPAVIKPGNSHTLTCQGSGGFTIAGYYMAWIRQFSDGKLQWLCYISSSGGDISYHDDVKGRFTTTRDNNNNKLTLKMDTMKIEDTAVYYCARQLGLDIWGPGTMVTVTSADPSPPSVFPMLPCCNALSSLTEVTIGCLSTDYLPAPVNVTWNSGSITTGIKNFPDTMSNNGKYISCSLLTISASDWKSKTYTCNVNHMNSGQKVDKIIPASKSNLPTVEVFQSSCGLNGLVNLVCLISGFSPKDVNITWLQDGKAISDVPSNNMDSQEKIITSKLSISQTDWDAGFIYTCKVNHQVQSESPKPIKESISKCKASSCFHPRVVLLPPSPKDLLITKEPKLTCVVSILNSTESLNISWKHSDAQGVTSKPEQNFDGTYTVNSTLKIRLSDWESKVPFTCNVEHSALSSPVEKSIKNNREDQPKEPTIFLFAPAVEKFNDEFVDVICLFKGFSHKNIYVQWKKNHSIIGEDMYINTEPILTDDNETYIMFSRALVYKSEWNRGATISCSGGIRKISSKSITKNRGK